MAKEEAKEIPKAPAVKTVRMVRPDGEPSTADVHPNEVENYAAGGWLVKER